MGIRFLYTIVCRKAASGRLSVWIAITVLAGRRAASVRHRLNSNV